MDDPIENPWTQEPLEEGLIPAARGADERVSEAQPQPLCELPDPGRADEASRPNPDLVDAEAHFRSL